MNEINEQDRLATTVSFANPLVLPPLPRRVGAKLDTVLPVEADQSEEVMVDQEENLLKSEGSGIEEGHVTLREDTASSVTEAHNDEAILAVSFPSDGVEQFVEEQGGEAELKISATEGEAVSTALATWADPRDLLVEEIGNLHRKVKELSALNRSLSTFVERQGLFISQLRAQRIEAAKQDSSANGNGLLLQALQDIEHENAELSSEINSARLGEGPIAEALVNDAAQCIGAVFQERLDSKRQEWEREAAERESLAVDNLVALTGRSEEIAVTDAERFAASVARAEQAAYDAEQRAVDAEQRAVDAERNQRGARAHQTARLTVAMESLRSAGQSELDGASASAVDQFARRAIAALGDRERPVDTASAGTPDVPVMPARAYGQEPEKVIVEKDKTPGKKFGFSRRKDPKN